MVDLAADIRLRSAPPAVPAGFIPRQDLADRLSAGVLHPVTLVSAAAGYGKTLTLASWVLSGSAPFPVAWLSLERSDDRLPAFWSAVLGGLCRLDAVPADSVLRELVPAGRFGLREVEGIRSGLADLPAPVTLVLDDFQHITGARLMESVALLLDHQPAQLRLVIATRYDPPLRLRRLRLADDLTEIRETDLRFDEEQAAALLSGHGIAASAEQVRVLLDRTQGWPAGLRLAAMGLDPDAVGEGVARFSGSDELVAEYLIEEVLSQLPPADRDFLLRISVVEQIDASLAEALSGRQDSQAMLERLAARNAFMVGMAGGATWFRCHPLFRELLLHQLSLRRALLPDLHERAARWFVERGDPIAAIRQLSFAGDWDGVGRVLVEHAAPEILTPNGPALASALEPAAARSSACPDPATLLAAAVCHFHRAEFDAMLSDVGDASGLLAASGSNDHDAADVLIGLMRVAHSRVANPARVADDAGLVLTLMDRIPRRRLPAVRHYNAIALTNLGAGQLWRGQLQDAQASLLAAETACRELGIGLPELTVQGHLSVLDAIRGRLPEAHERADSAEELAQRRGWTGEPQAAAQCVAQAMVALDRFELDTAQRRVDFGSAACGPSSDAACRVVFTILAAVIAAARGDARGAQRATGRLTAAADEFGDLPPLVAHWCHVAAAQAELCAGNAETALAMLPDTPVAVGYAEALRRTTRAACRLALDQPAKALDELGGSTIFPSFRGPMVEARVIAAVAAQRLRRDTAALASIGEAVDLASAAGIVRPFHTVDTAVVDLLRRHRTVVGRHSAFVVALLDVDRGRHPCPPPVAYAGEPLTEREILVLQYLPTMLKSADIAADLFVSVNTVKSQQQSIYRKLGVTTRRAAVERGRDLQLFLARAP